MSDKTNREIVEHYFKAYPSDWETMARLRHADFVEDWPQSGERIVGHENYRAIHESFPGGTPGTAIDRVVGTEDRLVMTPLFTPLRIVGMGDTFTVEARARYSDGITNLIVTIVELKDTEHISPCGRADEIRTRGLLVPNRRLRPTVFSSI